MTLRTVVLLILLLPSGAFALPRAATIANVGVRAADTAQTCWHLTAVAGWREMQLPVKTCGGVAAWNAGTAAAAWWWDRWIRRRGHPRWAVAQWVSAAGSAEGIAFTFTMGRQRGRK